VKLNKIIDGVVYARHVSNFKVGDKWRIRCGTISTICAVSDSHISWQDCNGQIYHTGPDGCKYTHAIETRDAIERVEDYRDYQIDEPVMVRDCDTNDWIPRYFAGLNDGGFPTAWDSGATKWSAYGERSAWLQCRRPTPEELGQ